MTIYIAAVLKIIVLEALVALLLASFFFESDDRRIRRWFDGAFGIVAAMSVLGYFNFGRFQYGGGFVNAWEQYHFFLGSKYLPEISYDNIYRASVVALGEQTTHVVENLAIRDLTTFDVEPARAALEDADAIKGLFSPARWDEFKSDLAFFFQDLGVPAQALEDHGNTGSPAWAAVACMFTARNLATWPVVNLLTVLDVVLLVILFGTVHRCFGWRVMCIAIVVTMMIPRAYDFLGGSILRLDWLFALGMSSCFLQSKKLKTAGVFMAYAIASKPITALFPLALGFKFALDTCRGQRISRQHSEMIVVSIATLAAIVVLSSLCFGGIGIWEEYVERILVTLHEKYYASNYSLRDIFLQMTLEPSEALFDWTPAAVAASLPEVNIYDFKVPFVLTRAALIATFLFVLLRHSSETFALGVGAFFVYITFVTNMYYWQMLMLPTLAFAQGYRKDIRKLLYLLFGSVFLMASYVFVHYGQFNHLQGYFGSYWLALFCLFIFGVELVSALSKRLFVLRQ